MDHRIAFSKICSFQQSVGFVMSVGVWPLAEISCSLLRRVYPDNSVTVAFDFEQHRPAARYAFMRSIGVDVVDDGPQLGHRGQLHRLICDSSYEIVVVVDDDVFVESGALETLLRVFHGNDIAGVIKCASMDGGRVYQERVDPCFLAVDTGVYKRNLDFRGPHGENEDGTYWDSGASVLRQARDAGLRVGCVEKMPEIDHVGRCSYLVLPFDKINLSCLAHPRDLEDVPRRTPRIDRFDDWRDRQAHFREPAYAKILAAADRVSAGPP